VNTALTAATVIVDGLRKLIATLVVLFFGYMIIAVLVQIAGRYLFEFAIDWTAETATFAQIWMVLLAGGLAMRDNLHVSVDALTSHLPVNALRGLIVVVTLPCLWFLLQAIIGSLALIDIGRIQSSPVLRLPMWIPYLSLPIGLGYFGLEFILAMINRWQDPKAEGSTT
jgi:TRAP-type C4-dicarboxylate transport system permease small subunit